MSTIAFLSLVNDRAQFTDCQASLRAIAEPFPEWLMVEPNQHGWNAAQGLNHGLERLAADWVVCIHQDVQFPPEFWRKLTTALRSLPSDVAVAGIVGCEKNGTYRGHIHDPNGHCFWGGMPHDVAALDEVVIAVRKSSGLRFCEDVPGFHCYGADFCYTAVEKGHRVVVIDAPLVHLSTGKIDASYEKASKWLMAKWGAKYKWLLPTPTMLLKDEARIGFFAHFWQRWNRRRDRLRRNTNDCGDPSCRASMLAIYERARAALSKKA